MERKDIIGICAGAAVAATAVAAALVVTRSRETVTSEPLRAASVQPTAPPPAARPASVFERQPEKEREDPVLAGILRATTLREAVAAARPRMAESFGESSVGTFMLLGWSYKRLAWTDVAVPKDETSFAMVRKDVDEERGKRLCLSGPIVQIQKDSIADLKYFVGLMESARQDVFHFYALGSTSDLVEGDHARFCGVITGLFDYNNSGGGVGHAVDIVGMFDLPENKK